MFDQRQYFKKGVHPKLIDASVYFLYEFPYFNEWMLRFIYSKQPVEKMAMPTAGVCYKREGINFIYCDEFFDSIDKETANWVCVHEIYHCLNKHINKQRGNKINAMLLNLAGDMIINDSIGRTMQMYNRLKLKEVSGVLHTPAEYKGKMIVETLAEWLIDKYVNEEEVKIPMIYELGKLGSNPGGNLEDLSKEKQKQWKDETSEKDKDGNEVQNEQIKTGYAKLKDIIDNAKKGIAKLADTHFKDEISKEEMDQIVEEINNSARIRGNMPGNFEEEIINGLLKPKLKWHKLLRKSISYGLGVTKYEDWTRPNRRNLPLPGHRKIGVKPNIIIDTSGSISSGDLRTFMTEIENIGSDNIYLIENDTKVQGEYKYRKGMWKKIKFKGRGGTVLQPALERLKELNRNKNAITVIMTDGWTDSLDFTGFSNAVIVTTDSECPITKGKVKQIKI